MRDDSTDLRSIFHAAHSPRRESGKARFERLTRHHTELWIAGVATVAAAGISAYASSSAASTQADALTAAAKKPKIVPFQPENPSDAYSAYYKLVNDQYPQLEAQAQRFNATDNLAYQTQLSRVDPNLMSNIASEGVMAKRLNDVADPLLHGKLPGDVTSQINRSTAYRALMGGYGADSGARHALTARDIGTTSLSLINQGAGLAAQAGNLVAGNVANTKAVSPYDFTGDSMLLTPQQLLARDDSNAAYANAVQNYNTNIQYQNALTQAAANSYNPTGAGIISGIGALTGSAAGQRTISGVASSVSGAYSDYQAQQATNNAYQGSYYNPIMDTNNYDDSGKYIGQTVYGPSGNYGGG